MSEKEIEPKLRLTETEIKLMDLVDHNRDEILQLLKDLIKIDSRTYEPTIYSDLSEIFSFANEYLEKNGLTTQMYYAPHVDAEGNKNEDKKWPNLIAFVEGQEPGKCVQFNGHLDIVPFTESQWRDDTMPLDPIVKGGRMYGRGSDDMKGGVACAMSALRILKTSGIPFNGKLQLWLVPDEEIDGHYGARYMPKEFFDVVNTDCTIIGEATGQSPVQSPVIIVGEKGIQWFRLIFTGASGHGSMPKGKSNTINKVNRFIANIKKLKLPHVKAPLGPLYLVKGLLSRFKIKDIVQVLKAASEEEPDPFDEDGVSIKPFFNSTISFNQIQAGEKVNVIPDVCTLSIDVRVLPGVSTQDIFDSLAEYATRIRYKIDFPNGFENKQPSHKKYKKIKDRPVDIKVEIISTHEGTFVEPDSEICQVMADSFENVYLRSALFFFAPGGTDATHMRNAGMKDCIVFGPAGANAHSANEYVNVEDIIKVTKVYLLTAYRMLTKE